jgi:hypothetical protein
VIAKAQSKVDATEIARADAIKVAVDEMIAASMQKVTAKIVTSVLVARKELLVKSARRLNH